MKMNMHLYLHLTDLILWLIEVLEDDRGEVAYADDH